MRKCANTAPKPGLLVGEGGFSLIELSVVLLISGVLMAGALSALRQWQSRLYLDTTLERLNTIDQALASYVIDPTHNGRLPCAADPTLSRADPNYGRATDCAAAPPPGTHSVANPARANRTVRIGAVPVRDLNLSENYFADQAGHLFTYAVTEIEAVNPVNSSLGAIDIVDENNVSVLTPAGAALYAVVAHGQDGKGAYSYDGHVQISPCASAPGKDQENCNGDFTFSAAQFSMATDANRYDDYISYKTSVVPVDHIGLCNQKRKFYSPSTPGADADGCMPPYSDVCGEKYLLYSPATPGADADGCISNVFTFTVADSEVASACMDGTHPTPSSNMPFASTHQPAPWSYYDNTRFWLTCTNRWCVTQGYSSGAMHEYSPPHVEIRCTK